MGRSVPSLCLTTRQGATENREQTKMTDIEKKISENEDSVNNVYWLGDKMPGWQGAWQGCQVHQA
jgi:hypothetical protein